VIATPTPMPMTMTMTMTTPMPRQTISTSMPEAGALTS
jgi:hypothetical protein